MKRFLILNELHFNSGPMFTSKEILCMSDFEKVKNRAVVSIIDTANNTYYDSNKDEWIEF